MLNELHLFIHHNRSKNQRSRNHKLKDHHPASQTCRATATRNFIGDGRQRFKIRQHKRRIRPCKKTYARDENHKQQYILNRNKIEQRKFFSGQRIERR